MPARLVDRTPTLVPSQLLGSLVPPPRFAEVTFDNYQPSPAYPTQSAAIAALGVVAGRLVPQVGGERTSWWRRSAAPPEGRPGIYLDGGFGVGKTHLLAALWHVVPEPKHFCTFAELIQVVDALGFAQTIEALGESRLLCIDEFELDEPGDTDLMASLLAALTERGTQLAATSNALPERQGEERFSAEDFLREIHSLSAQFDVIRVDGQDYRYRGGPRAPTRLSEAEGDRAAADVPGSTLDDFDAVLSHLAGVHPSRYGALVEGVVRVCWRDVTPVDDQAAALRLVILVDRLYDHDIEICASGTPLDQIFPDDLLTGGYRRKYLRAISRLVDLTPS